MAAAFTTNITIKAENDTAAQEKIQVIQNLLENVDDKSFSVLKKKIAKNPKLFKELVKYLKFI